MCEGAIFNEYIEFIFAARIPTNLFQRDAMKHLLSSVNYVTLKLFGTITCAWVFARIS